MVKFTVYVTIEAYDDSKLQTPQDDCWHPSEERDLAEFDNLEDAQKFMDELPKGKNDG